MADDDIEQTQRRVQKSLRDIGGDLERLNRIARDATSPGGGIGGVDLAFGRIARGALGATGVAAALYQVGSALETVAQKSVGLQMFARNANLSTEAIDQYRQGMRRLGMESIDADRMIGTVTNRLNELRSLGNQSSLFQELSKSQGGAAFAEQLKATKDNAEAMQLIMAKWPNQSAASKFNFAQLFGGDEATWENLNRAMRRNIVTQSWSREESERYLNFWIDAEVTYDKIWKRIALHGMTGANAIAEALRSSGMSAKGTIDAVNASTDEFVTKLKATIEEIKNIKRAADDMAAADSDPARGKRGARSMFGFVLGNEGRSPIGSWADLTPYELLSGTRYEHMDNPDEDQGRKEAPFGRRAVPRLRERYPSTSAPLTDFGGMSRTTSIQQEQVSLLTEIRDTLQGRTPGLGTGGSSTGGPEYAPGGARRNLARWLGMDREGASGSPADPSGGTSGGTRADRNNNPGNIEFGSFAKRMGATGSDGRFAIFPDRETGFKAAESLLGGKGYAGLTLSQIGSRWAEGDSRWAQNVSKATGIPLNAVPTAEQRSAIARTGIPRAEGSRIGANSPGQSYSGGTGDGLPSAVLDEARRVAAREGTGESVQSYIRSQGYNVNSAWCGDFVASVVRGSGGTPVAGHSVASNWRKYGMQVDTPQPGDIAVRRGVRTGQTGSHVTIVDSVEGNRFIGLGGNQSQRRSRFPVGGFDYFRGQDEARAADMRDKMDREQRASKQGPWGKLNGEIRFTGIPPGVKTDINTEGDVFQELKVTRSKQGEIAGGSIGQPFSGVW